MDETYPSRDERLKAVTDKLEAGVTELFTGDRFADYLRTMSKFHQYSFGNILLIAMQFPGATQVAGFHDWKRKFERHVKKGEKGIQILAPCSFRGAVEYQKLDPVTRQPMVDAMGNPIMERRGTGAYRFTVVTVFDVSQTEGKELPTIATDLTGSVEQYEHITKSLEKLSPVPIIFEDLPGTTQKGYFSSMEGRIVIRSGMNEAQTLKTMIHEVAHAKLHAEPIEMIRRNMQIDAVVYADTTMEFPAMYEHIDQVERLLKAERGIPVTRLRPERNFENLMFEAIKENSSYDFPGHGWPNAAIRWCTGEFKIRLISAFSQTLPAKPYHYIGFAVDEPQRLKRKRNQHPSKRYPLVEWGVTEAQALERCYQEGFHWNGLYEDFSRVSCWCCPLQSLQDLRTLRERYPEMWAELRRLDDRAIAQFGRDNSFGQFRPKESVRMLELRFDFEKEWAAHGWSIRSRAFYRALNLLYQKNFPQQENPVDELLSYATQEDLQMLSRIGSPPKQSKKKSRKTSPSR